MSELVGLVFAQVVLYPLIVVELILVLLAIRYAKTAPAWLAAMDRWIAQMAARRTASVALVGALALVGSLVYLSLAYGMRL